MDQVRGLKADGTSPAMMGFHFNYRQLHLPKALKQ